MFHKELIVALVYAGGIVTGPYSIKGDVSGYELIQLMIQYALLAYVNLLLFALFEYETDKLQQFSSLARTIGKTYTRYLVFICLILVLTSALINLFVWNSDTVMRDSQLIVALMTVPLGCLLTWPQYFQHEDRYRLVGDAIFFIPLIFLWVM